MHQHRLYDSLVSTAHCLLSDRESTMEHSCYLVELSLKCVSSNRWCWNSTIFLLLWVPWSLDAEVVQNSVLFAMLITRSIKAVYSDARFQTQLSFLTIFFSHVAGSQPWSANIDPLLGNHWNLPPQVLSILYHRHLMDHLHLCHFCQESSLSC